MRTIGALVFCIGLSVVTGAVGAIASAGAPEFYRALDKPAWAPPAGLFGPVWTALYLMMGVAALLVWRQSGWAAARGALTLFAVHLLFNGLWSWLFFRWHLGAGSFAEIVVLWLMIVTLTVWFWRIRPVAGVLLLPYLVWVTYAAALNASLWQRNPQILS